MLKRVAEREGADIPFYIDGRKATARAGDSVAAAMLACGVGVCRQTPAGGVPRGPYCMMGTCFDCLVTIDGVASRQGCMVPVAAGMRVETQRGKRDIANS
jgi:predicted molibdopterin-dependent oxidoreductase YjgC